MFKHIGILKYFYVIHFYYGDNIQNDDLREQIAALRSEVRALGDSFITLRQEDVRSALARQIRPILIDKTDRVLFELRSSGSLDHSHQQIYRVDMVKWLDKAVQVFEREGDDGALKFLNENSGRSVVGEQAHPALRSLMEDLDAQLRSYYRTYDNVLKIPRNEREVPESKDVPERLLSPLTVEKALSPLSNAIRVRILQLLSGEDDGLATLSRRLGLKKGHLQFHLKVLLEGGYINFDRKSHLYSLSSKGQKALQGLVKMIDDLELS